MKDLPRMLLLRDTEAVEQAAPGAVDTFPVQAMDRAAGAPAVRGNRLSIQFEGPLTFDAWIEAIDGAERFVHFENYILRDDRVGQVFRDALVAKAKQGVPVRVLYDWVGCWATPARYWRGFREAGVEVRVFNRPALRDPFGVLQRDHRKLVCVDGRVAFVGGFCVGVEWAGTPTSPPWRDTGVEIVGPAAAAAARSFERVWALMGAPVPDELRASPEDRPVAGDTPVWVIEGAPGRALVYRTIQLVAANAQNRLWITDPYFVAPRPVAEALGAAANDGVDVRILVPAHNNWPWVGSLSRGGYRFLIESGVRLFEWQGPMIHAKTSVADGLWGRVGSSNLNNASLLGNFELDVGVLDEGLARQLEGLFLADLASSVEIVLPTHHMSLYRAFERAGEPPTLQAPLEPEGTLTQRFRRQLRDRRRRGRSPGWKIAHLVRAGATLGTVMAGQRSLGREDRTLLGTVALLFVGLALFAWFLPVVLGVLVAGITGWLGIVTGVRGLMQWRRARKEEHNLRTVYERLGGDSR
ncbi:MAG TPA: cardiolipin synthase B [Gemmatimonadetes bacterium]|nr:cardiolipin synthase B [Gemmatimonadota bacterium]|tara:strand:- start:19954 stop:21528 length:1575 start_codon:yes stop_codon:yes gene_type:complete